MKRLINKYWAYLFVAIPLGLQLIFFFYPLVNGFIYSLTDWTGLTRNYNIIGLDNYVRVFQDQAFFASLAFTILFTLALVIGEIVVGIWVASLLNKKIRAVGFFRTWYFFPAVLSTVTIGLIFSQLFNYGLPQIGELLGIEWLKNNLLFQEKSVFWSVLFVALWQGLAMPIVILLSGFQSIPEEIKEAAAIDGADAKQTFFQIELPFLLPSISMVFIMAMKSGLTAFDLIYALTKGGPDGATKTLGLLVFENAFNNNQYGYANALAVVLFVIITVISVVQITMSKKFEV